MVVEQVANENHENVGKSKKRKKKQKGTAVDVTSNFFEYSDLWCIFYMRVKIKVKSATAQPKKYIILVDILTMPKIS